MPTLNVPQAQFLQLPHKYRAFVAGYGSGKTWVGGAALCKHAWEFPSVPTGYFAPTYPHIRDIFFPTIEEVAADWGLTCDIKEANKEVHLYNGRTYRGTIICRSMERPGDIVGFKIGRALVDEADVMRANKAAQAWRKIIARLRHTAPGLKNGVDLTTTPEGFGFAYDRFVRQVAARPEVRDLYGMVQASTYDNAANLPEDYISSLRASYPANLIEAYINGQFVNLASGSVYPDFCRGANHSPESIKPAETLHVGMDFNVLNMTAIVSVIRDGWPLTLAEHCGVRDTPTMARKLRDTYPEHAITVYPDASGGNTSSKNASESDLTILREAGFSIRVDGANPRVRDRVNAVCAMIHNSEGARRWKLNTDACPKLTEALEQQAYDASGEPDKAGGLDHAPDALGYFIANRYPVAKRVALVSALRI